MKPTLWKRASILAIACLVASLLDAQTGAGVPELSAIERPIEGIIAKYGLPGASFAIARGGKLIYARGFGFADRDRRIPVQPASLFRIGSISKPLTAVTLLKLQEQGKLSLDDKVFDLLSEYKDAIGDQRIRQVTVRQLLHHTAGWDPQRSGDPLFPEYGDIVTAGGSFPPAQNDLIRYWLATPLDDNPGAAYHYSNFGFVLAGRVIEKVTGLSYSEAVRQLVLRPQGITHTRLGRALQGQTAPTEVRYYDSLSRLTTSIFSAAPQQVPEPYGGFSMTLVDSAGGWIASATDLVRLFTGINNSRGSLLQPASFQQFIERPAGLPLEAAWYGLGIQVFAANGGGYALGHDGGIPGTYGVVLSLADSSTFAFLTNTNPGGDDPTDFENDLLAAVLGGIAAVSRWPAGDQFDTFFPAEAPAMALRAETSAASFSSGAVSPGEAVTLFGSGLGPEAGTGLRLENGRVASQLEGVRVYFDDIAAPLLFVQNGQINAVAPFGLADKADTAVMVDNKGVWTASLPVPIVAARPAVFLRGGLAAALNQDGSLHSASNPASRGSVVALYATGLGVFTSPVDDGSVAQSTDPKPAQTPTVTLNGRPVEIQYAGPAPGLVYGVYQINIRIPDDAASGVLPLIIRSGNAASPYGAALAIR